MHTNVLQQVHTTAVWLFKLSGNYCLCWLHVVNTVVVVVVVFPRLEQLCRNFRVDLSILHLCVCTCIVLYSYGSKHFFTPDGRKKESLCKCYLRKGFSCRQNGSHNFSWTLNKSVCWFSLERERERNLKTITVSHYSPLDTTFSLCGTFSSSLSLGL